VLSKLRVDPGDAARLDARDPGDRLGIGGKAAAAVVLDGHLARLRVLQTRLFAEGARAALLVLQGVDASGKDGTIRRVFSGINPQGCRVASFKAPSTLESAHDYLWRIHAALPRRGEIGIFNRSHYEDLVTASLHGTIATAQRRRRVRHVRDFERMLVDEGTVVVKVWLHVSKHEQRARLQARLDDPEKRWKFDPDDLATRRRWDEVMALYDEVVAATSTRWAPWYVVPADHRWVRDVAVAALLVRALERLDPRFPEPDPRLDGVVVEERLADPEEP
jgi:PPK2 family polyphosphate:nucleotide phosphotransferase